MKTAYIFTFLTTVVVHVSASGGSCYAPPMFYGTICPSDTAVTPPAGATSSFRIYYDVAVIGDTLVCCQGKGFNPSETWSSIGCGHDGFSGSIVWGNNIARPAIKCLGSPTGTAVTWSH